METKRVTLYCCCEMTRWMMMTSFNQPHTKRISASRVPIRSSCDVAQ